MDEETLERVCRAIESAGKEAEEAQEDFGYALSNDIVFELHQVFGSYQEGGAPNANGFDVDAQLWEEVAAKRVPLGLVGQGLAGVMEKGGCQGFMAGDVFLGMLLAPGCPLYSLFSPLAFLALIRCIRNSCRRFGENVDNSNNNNSSERPRKGQKKKGKRVGKRINKNDDNDTDNDGNDDADHDGFNDMGNGEGSHSQGQGQSQRGTVSVQELIYVLCRFELLLNVLHLKEHPESLKSLVELLVEIQHLICDFAGEEDSTEGPSRGARARKTVGKSSAPLPSVSGVCFRMMQKMLLPNHGDPTTTGVTLLKALTPSILLLQPSGSVQQRTHIRSAALCFVTKEMVDIKSQSVRKAVVAFPRYLSMKAPEKTEARALAVEAISMVVRVLRSSDQRKFGQFVAKLSRGKPRYRLMAVDLAVALLGSLPDPLGLNREADTEEEGCPMEEQLDCFASQDDNGKDVNEINKEAQEVAEEDAGEDTQFDGQDDQGSAQIDSNAQSSEANSQATEDIWWGVKCLEALLHRCSDKVPAIRARALTNMAQTLELLSTDMRHRAHLQGLLGFGAAGIKLGEGLNAQPSHLSECFTPGQGSLSLGGQTPSPESNAAGLGATPITPGAGHRDLGFLLRRRCMDDKVAVRKAALILMTKSTALLGKPPDEAMLQAMGAACGDSMVSIKKAALSALSEVLRKFPADRVISEWLQSVPPLVMDNESSVQEECLNLFQELVLDRVSSVAAEKASGKRSNFSDMTKPQDPDQEMEILFPEGVLPLLKGMSDGNVASCVKRICMSLGKKGRLRAGIALALQNIITTSESLALKYSIPIEKWTAPPGAWLLLSEVSTFVPKALSWKFLRHHWQLLDQTEKVSEVPQGTPYDTPAKQGMNDSFEETEFMSVGWAADRVFLLQTISSVAVELPPDAAAELAHDLLERLEAFNMHPTEVGAHVKALITLCKRKAATSEEGNRLIIVWVDQLLSKAEEILDEYISKFSNADKNDSFQTPQPTSRTRSRTKRKGKSDLSSLSIQVVTAIFTIGALVLVCPAAKLGRLVTLLQAMVTSKNSNSEGKKHASGSLLPKQVEPAVYTQSWVTLGKICLADDKLAKSCIPLFVQELEITDSPAVRNNIMVAMTDFCVRYTALVDGEWHLMDVGSQQIHTPPTLYMVMLWAIEYSHKHLSHRHRLCLVQFYGYRILSLMKKVASEYVTLFTACLDTPRGAQEVAKEVQEYFQATVINKDRPLILRKALNIPISLQHLLNFALIQWMVIIPALQTEIQKEHEQLVFHQCDTALVMEQFFLGSESVLGCFLFTKDSLYPVPLLVVVLAACSEVRNTPMGGIVITTAANSHCCIAKLSKSLRDPCELVRRQAFILLARLLQRDYVKWKGMLFHRFLLALVDESEKIRQLADFLFGSILKTKAPLLAYNSFVEAIFILNDCHAHAGHSELLQTSESERKLFSLRGNHEAIALQRMHIYVSLLKQMAPEHLLATSAKLCAEILAAAADGLLDLDDASAQCVLQDALQILACKEMRIQPNRAIGGAAENVELEEETGAAAFAAAKGRVVTQIAKKNLIQNAIPIFIELKRLLESKNSPLTGCLMECLRMILKEYKNEIDEILVADKQLQKELLYDIQKFEAIKTKSKVAAAVATVQGTVPQQVPDTTNDNVAGNVPASVQKPSSVGSKLPPKNPMSDNRAYRGKDMDKENADIQRAPSLVKASAMKRKSFLSPGVEKSGVGRVKWLDQASGPIARTPEAPTRTPRVVPTKGQGRHAPNPFGTTDVDIISPNNIPLSRRHRIASAVADVAAAATVTAVLKEVATGSSTPLHSMSIPRLKPSVPSTMKARVGSAENSIGLSSQIESQGQDVFQSIRRRQSFSDVDD
eukprot:Gb_33189 [translate_table: standard]